VLILPFLGLSGIVVMFSVLSCMMQCGQCGRENDYNCMVKAVIVVFSWSVVCVVICYAARKGTQAMRMEAVAATNHHARALIARIATLQDIEADGSLCAICLQSMQENACALSCAHAYHKDCVVRWFITTPTCPICRRGVV